MARPPLAGIFLLSCTGKSFFILFVTLAVKALGRCGFNLNNPIDEEEHEEEEKEDEEEEEEEEEVQEAQPTDIDNVMAALVIFISSDSSDESVGSSIPRVILIGSIPVEVPVASEVGAAAVTSPVGVLELDIHSSSKVDPSESSLPPVPVAPMVSPFLCSDDSESDTELLERHVSHTPHDVMLARWRSRVASRSSSPTTSTSEIHTPPIPPAPPAIVAPSTDIISPVDAPPGIHRRRAILIRPGQDIPIGRLYRIHPGGPSRALTTRKSVRPLPSHRLALRYTSHHLDRFTFGSSSDHSSSDHSSADHSPADQTSGHSTSDQSLSRRSSPSLPQGMRSRCKSPTTTVPSSIPASRALIPTRADLLPPHKRYKDSILPEDSVEEDIEADVLADIEADTTAVEVAANMEVEAGIDAGIGMEVDVRVYIEEEDEGEAESSDRGTMEVGVDVVAEIDIPDGMLMPDAVERLKQVEEVVQDIYRHVMEIPIQRVEDIKTRQRELEVRSLIAGGERAGLLDHVAALQRSNTRL
ncbi:hypothetical protein Tco_0526894 [Tanacetum coccineum]